MLPSNRNGAFQNVWLVLGSSPNAARQLAAAMFNAPRNVTTITTNRGLLMLPQPNYYLVFSLVGERRYRPHYKRAQRRGTKIVGCNYKLPRESPTHPQVNWVGTEHKPPKTCVLAYKNPAYVCPCDVIADVGPFYRDPPEWAPGQPFVTRSSGLLCVQFAIDHGADLLLMAGFEGYGTVGSPYFDGEDCDDSAQRTEWTQRFYGPTMANIMQGSIEHTRFVMLGKPTFPLKAPNLAIIDVPST